MNTKRIILGVIAAILMSLCFSRAHAANYPLEIIQPRTGLTTINRFYKAYPGLEYKVRPAIISGEYPFTYTLTTYPSGMTIDSSTGVITWSNPTVSGSPHNVTLSVTDAEDTTQTVSWTITVTTSGFYFVDAINGQTVANGGTGTLANPWKTIEDWYETKSTNTYQYGFLYFRTGTYTPPALEDGTRLAFVSNYKPQVWLAYPGESPVFDMNAAYVSVYSGGDNFYVQGIEFNNISNSVRRAVSIGGAVNNVTFFDNDFSGTTYLDGTNQAHVFISDGGDAGSYWSFQDNNFHDSSATMAIEGYNTNKVLVEDNFVSNLDGSGARQSHGIGPKAGNTRWDIRHNQLFGNDICEADIWLGGLNYDNYSDMEVRYNLVIGGSGSYTSIYVNMGDTDMGPVYLHRNTVSGGSVLVKFGTTGRGPYTFSNNAIQNIGSGVTYSSPNPAESGVVILSNNLTGNSGLVDSNGLLINRSYVGTYGWETGSESPDTFAPASPSGLSVS